MKDSLLPEQDKYTYYHLAFKNCGLDYDYTIVRTVIDITRGVFDEEDSEAEVIITPKVMTKAAYQEFLNSLKE